jgi:hypothetical protein
MMFRLLGLGILCAGLAGCAAVAPVASLLHGTGATAGLEVHTQTSVRLEEANFVTVRTNVVGISKGFSLLGFITFRAATVNEAMNRLYTQAHAEEGRPQTLANLIVEHSGIYVILFSIPKVAVRADLIEFIPVQEEEAPSGNLGVQRVSARPVMKLKGLQKTEPR